MSPKNKNHFILFLSFFDPIGRVPIKDLKQSIPIPSSLPSIPHFRQTKNQPDEGLVFCFLEITLKQPLNTYSNILRSVPMACLHTYRRATLHKQGFPQGYRY